jgi:hypothetical protein
VTDDRESSAAPLPLSYRLTIVLSVLLMFALGVVYFSLRNQRVTTSFQVYGSTEVTRGLPAAFRLVQFDNEGNRGNLPVLVRRVTVLQEGAEPVVQPGTEPVGAIPADLVLETGALQAGPATLRFDVEGWNGEQRTIEAAVTVLVPKASDPLRFQLRAPLEAPLEADRAHMDLALPGAGLVEGIPNTLWLRVADEARRPVEAHPRYRLGDGESQVAPSTGRLGLTDIVLAPRGPNQTLVIDVPFRDETVSWEEMVAPSRLVRLLGPPLVTEDDPPLTLTFPVETDGTDRALFCTLWRQRTALAFAQTETSDGRGSVSFDLPVRGLYWVSCDDHFLSAAEFLTARPVMLTREPDRFLQSLVAMVSGDPFFAAWPPVDRLTPTEKERAFAYFASRMAPDGPEFTKLLNTYDGDVEALRQRAGTQRDAVLILLGLVGLGLLLWAIAVAIRQHTRLSRSFREFQAQEDVGDDLSVQGITRRKGYMPALLVILTVIANLAALIWLLRLVFF